jgi:hypothetical protein
MTKRATKPIVANPEAVEPSQNRGQPPSNGQAFCLSTATRTFLHAHLPALTGQGSP